MIISLGMMSSPVAGSLLKNTPFKQDARLVRPKMMSSGFRRVRNTRWSNFGAGQIRHQSSRMGERAGTVPARLARLLIYRGAYSGSDIRARHPRNGEQLLGELQ